MPWISGKKKIPLDKAMALARKRLIPLWYRSKPMLWMDEKILRVLEPEFTHETWCLFAFNLQSYWSYSVAKRVIDFTARYSDLKMHFGLVIPLYKGQAALDFDEMAWITAVHFQHMVIGDPESVLKRALGFPDRDMGFIVFRAGKPVLAWDFPNESFPVFEKRFQEWLRASDPGLPLIDPKEDDHWSEIS